YVIKNKKILSELDNDATKKGKYNLFQTFAVEYPALLMELVDADNLSLNVYQKVIDDLYNFLVELYSEFVICKTPCSYDLSGADEYLLNLYSLQELTNFKRKAKFNGYKLTFHRFLKKFYGKK
ncbi:MAG: hypothetical protein MJ185_07245, partial [Treponema sp.]|nr:hypothetical protein [Treponema sp.]